MSSPYENIPQRIGNAERETAVERLRVNLDQGRLDQTTYEERVATALAATTQDDLDPLFHDLPPVVSSTTYELYPHQSMATAMPTPYATEPEPTPYTIPPRTNPAMEWFNSAPTWAKVIVVVVFLTLVAGLFRFGGWWFIFFFPGIFGWWGRSNQVRNRQNRQRRN